MRPQLAILLACIGTAGGAPAQPPESSVATVISVVRAAIQKKHTDARLAKELGKIRLVQSLDNHTIEELQSEGAGPKSVAVLMALRDISEGLPAPAALPQFPAPPAPFRDEQDRILASASNHGLNYTHSLPDFICSETVRRYEDFENRGAWKLKDTLDVRLTYFGQHEEYKLVAMNGRPSGRSFRSVGGAISEGEFGSILSALFDRRSRTAFRWDHWTHLRGRAAHVFYFRIAQANSNYKIEFQAPNRPHVEAIVGGHGYLYVDGESGEILRILREADMPQGFPVARASTMLDYDFADVAGRRYLLPLRADIRMYSDYVLNRNEVEFSDYRKFSGEANITFDAEK